MKFSEASNRFGVMGGFGFMGLIACAFTMVLSTGCTDTQVVVALNPHAGFESVSQSEEVHINTVKKVIRQDALAIVEDFDLLLMTERPTRLTKWHNR
ncbi:MAG: hypothetical protein ACPGXK_14945 [Phycisphaerae bacterium]